MKGSPLVMSGLVILAIGIIFILCNSTITPLGLVVAAGIAFVAVGMFNIMFVRRGVPRSRGLSSILTTVANGASVVLGVCMLVFDTTFEPMISFIFALIVALMALWQFFLLGFRTRPVQMPAWMFVFPVLLVAGAVYIFIVRASAPGSTIMLAAGISFAVAGLAQVCEGIALGSFNSKSRKKDPANILEDIKNDFSES